MSWHPGWHYNTDENEYTVHPMAFTTYRLLSFHVQSPEQYTASFSSFLLSPPYSELASGRFNVLASCRTS